MRALMVVVMMVGCGPARLPGAPEPGSACVPTDPRECITAATIGMCVERKWAEWPCVGACANASDPRCEIVTPKKEGDACPPGSIDGGTVACVAVDGGTSNSVLKCISGVAKAVECVRCADHGLGVTCQ